MGRSTTPKYRIEFRANVHVTPFARDAKMNNVQLEQFRKDMNYSFNYGHNRPKDGVIPHISGCTMVEQHTGNVIAKVNGPMFEVV